MVARGKRRLCWLVLGAVQALPGAAGAEPTVVLRWSAPAECPQKERATAEIETLLGQPLAQQRAQQLEFDARLQRRAGTYELELESLTAEGKQSRVLSDDDCARLTEAASWIIALAIDPERVRAGGASPTAEPRAEEETKPTTTPPTHVPATEPSAEPRRPQLIAPRGAAPPIPPLHFVAALGPVLAVGPLPHLAWGGAARLAVSGRSFELAVSAEGYWPQTEEVPGHAPARVGARFLSAGLRGCYLPPGLPLVLLACGGPQVGQLAGFGEAVDNERSPSGLWSALLLGATARTRGSGWFLQAGLEGGPVLVRQAFGVSIDGAFSESFRSAPWVASAFAGFGWRSR